MRFCLRCTAVEQRLSSGPLFHPCLVKYVPPSHRLLPSRLTRVATDLLITLNVPYPDRESAMRSPAGRDSFVCDKASNSCCDGDSTCERHTSRGQGEESAKAWSDEERCTTDDGVGVSYGSASKARSETEKDRKPCEADVADECDTSNSCMLHTAAGAEPDSVTVLRTLLHSFAILDWSLFC